MLTRQPHNTNMKKYKLSPEEYNEILKSIQLSVIGLDSSRTELRRGLIDEGMNISVTNESEFSNEKTGFSAKIHLKLTANNDDKKQVLKMEASYYVFFEASADITEDFFEIYKSHGLIMNVWPFFREFVFDHTSKMNIKPLTLPLIKQ